MAMIVLLAAAILLQDDVSRQIERLKSDAIDERESAIRELEAIGSAALPALQKEAAAVQDLETRYRIQALLKSIPRREALAKVFGATKRVTYSAREAPLREVLDALGKPLGETLRLEGPDAGSTVTIELKNATLWEALDGVARAAKIRYEYRKDGVVFLQGQEPAFPVRYSEQFRISVVEVKRIQYRKPGSSEDLVLVVPEIEYQRNMNPAEKYGAFRSSVFEIEQIVDPQGNNLRSRAPWGPGSLSSRRPFGIQEFYYAKADSKTLTIQGVAKAKFSKLDQEVVLPIEGEVREAKVGDATFTLSGYTPGATRSTVTIQGKIPSTPGAPDPPLRVKKMMLLGPDNQRVTGQGDRGSFSSTEFTYTYEFPPLKFKPEKFVFEWTAEIFSIDMPFRLEGIPVPQPQD